MRRLFLKISASLFLYTTNSSHSFSTDELSTADVCSKVLPGVFRLMMIQPRTNALKSIGSGFFISRDGKALTASHTLLPEHKMVAKLDSGEEFPVSIINSHPLTDIALLKVEVSPKSLVYPIELGNSDNLRRGEQVIHIGNTMYSQTNDIDVGYVNKIEDDTPEWLKQHIKGDLAPPESGLNFIKTTGSVRPGFSGGPLVNMKAQAVGLISRVYVQSHPTGIEHEGASIPINFVQNIIKQFEIAGAVEKPYVGLSFTPTGTGLAVVKVQPGSPAERAGVMVGDVIVTANSKELKTPEDFFKIIGYKIGVVLDLEIIRNGRPEKVKIAT